MRGLRTTLLGALLCGCFWYFAWSNLGLVSRYAFFPLWLGYIVLVNGIGELVFADSLWRRAGADFLWLFVLSAPFWWFFECLNALVNNWHYIFPSEISTLHFAIESTIDFSTVLPAVLSTTFLCYLGLKAARHPDRRFAPSGRRLGRGKKISSIDARSMRALSVVGFLCLVLLWLAPNKTFPLVWIAPFLVIEPWLYLNGYPSLLKQFSQGQRSLSAAAMTAASFTGFWWECWNFYSMPKWVYTVPYVGFWKIFEMPALGYIAYPFFGLIVLSYTIGVAFLCFGAGAKLTRSIVLAFDLDANPPA